MKQTCKLSVFLTILVTTSCYLVMLSDWTVVSRDSECVETLYRANSMEIYLQFRLHKSKKNKQKRTSCVASGGCGKGGCGW